MPRVDQTDIGLSSQLSEIEVEAELLGDPGITALDYLERNRAAWERWATEYARVGRKAWQESELRWGIWGVPESEIRLFENVDASSDVVELGCGTASVSAWLTRMGHRLVAVDFAAGQIETARRLQDELGPSFRLINSNAEDLHYDAASFDVALSEYGTSLWSKPSRWLPEAHRLLRPGGLLIFLTNSALLMACTPADGGPVVDRLLRDYFSLYRVEFANGPIEFHLPHGRWIRVLRSYGFTVENLIETRPPPGSEARFGFVSLEWAQRWPSEEIWVARKLS